MDVPETRYACSGDASIAYQVVGEGPPDLVVVPTWLSHLELLWEVPAVADTLRRLAGFSRLILFDRRGTGLSGGSGGGTIDEQIDDVRAVLAAAASERPALLAFNDGCAMAAVFAAAQPEVIRALVLFNPMARVVTGDGYDFGDSPEHWEERTREIVEHWGTTPAALVGLVVTDAKAAAGWARFQRFSMAPSTAAAMRAVAAATDVRRVLPSIQCPTLVLRRSEDRQIDPGHSRYVADHVPGADLVELPGSSPLMFFGDQGAPLIEIERFLTGTHRPRVSDRVLATVLFTDIVASTERAADLGDSAWRSLLEQHDSRARAAIERQRGRLVKSLGDGVLAVFDAPSRAITAATALRDVVRSDLGLDIRAGLHTGEVELLADDDVGGLSVHIGARIGSLAGAGEVLVSSTVRDLTVGSGHTLTDRGDHELKGIPGHWRIFAVEA